MALHQCARTWAPHPLPVDRIAVHAGAPAAGRAQVYERWLPADDPAHATAVPLRVISLGLLDATGRPLDDQQLVGALATKVAALVADRYQRQPAAAGAPTADTASSPQTAACPSRSPAADRVDSAASVDQDLGALMARLRRQAGPLEPESGPPTAN